MKKIEQFTNKYSVSKSLKFKAIPVGKTNEWVKERQLLESDEKRASDYKDVKILIDELHKQFIDRVLHTVKIPALQEYAGLFGIKKRSDEEEEEIKNYEDIFRTTISNAFKNDPGYNELFGKEIIERVLPERLEERKAAGEDVEELLEKVSSFHGFTSAFGNYHDIRTNLYEADAKSGRVASRCIDDNLPRFLSNITTWNTISSLLDEEKLAILKKDVLGDRWDIKDLFSVDFFNYVLPQDGIDLYNAIIGGYSKEDGSKVQGLNEIINLYSQKIGKKLPAFEFLYKQLLSDHQGLAFVSYGFLNDEDIITELSDALTPGSEIHRCLERISSLFDDLSTYEATGIYIKNDTALTDFSNIFFGNWNAIQNKWNTQYDAVTTKKNKETDKYLDERKAAFKRNKSFSLEDIRMLMPEAATMYTSIRIGVQNKILAVKKTYDGFIDALRTPIGEKSLRNNGAVVEKIKNTLDAYKELESYIKMFKGTGKEAAKDEAFYSEYNAILDCLMLLDRLYNATRNYITQKPYSLDKYKLYFENPNFLGGWDINNEPAYLSTMLRKDGLYYLAVISKGNSKVFKSMPAVTKGSDCYEKMILKQIPSASKYLSVKQIRTQDPPAYVMDFLAKRKADPKSVTKEEITAFIRYIQDDFLVNYPMIQDGNGKSYFDFHFKKPEEYDSLNEFFSDVDVQAYSVRFEAIPAEHINKLVDDGIIYLFQLYNKDFSKASHGTPDLHTMYFKALFDAANKNEIRLAGGAELFFRKASLKKEELVIHPANRPMNNKNPLNPNKTRTLTYNVYKDKRFSTDQYELHFPVTINKACNTFQLNLAVRKLLKNDDNPYIIGINRGERNLIYIVVIDGSGKIIEQFSLNEIVTKNRNIENRTNYRELLDRREKERDEQRRDWKSIAGIKAIKEGYISQVVHKVCELIDKYDAVVAIEDLNAEFVNSRAKVEKNVYQKFEKMLIDKLNYMVDKSKPITEPGGVLHGLQLSNRFESFQKMGFQNGFMFYVPTYYISKVDPTTGFVDLLKPRYENIEQVRDFIKRFNSIAYNGNHFEFKFDYSNFEGGAISPRKEWTICSYGPRARFMRNPEKNNQQELVVTENITTPFVELFDKYGIAYMSCEDLREAMCSIKEANFYKSFIDALRLLLQMRNPGVGDDGFFISPVKNNSGCFFFTKDRIPGLPESPDANDAYNIARKTLWAIKQFNGVDDANLLKVKTNVTREDWLKFVQNVS